MWYLRLYSDLMRKEAEFYEREGWSMGFGSPVLFLMGIAVPMLAFFLIGGVLVRFGVREDILTYAVLGGPFFVLGCLLYFGERNSASMD